MDKVKWNKMYVIYFSLLLQVFWDGEEIVINDQVIIWTVTCPAASGSMFIKM